MEDIMRDKTVPGIIGLRATLRLGWRNTARNRRRTLITASTIAIAIFLLQISAALMKGLERQSFDNLINYQTAHAKLFADGYFSKREDLPLDYALEQLDDLQASLTVVNGVAAATPRLVFQAHLSTGYDQIPCLGTGIQVRGSDSDVFRIPQAVVEGDYLTPGEDAMLLGSALAELLEVSVGDWLTVLTKTQAGAYEAMDLPISGLVGTGNPLIDQNSFLIPLETARYMLDMEQQATEVAIRFASASNERVTLRRLKDRVDEMPGVELKGWEEVEEDFMALVKMKRMGQSVFLGIFAILAIVGIANTILMSSFERTREIGMLMAMGLRGGGIRRLFLTEGAMIGLLGGAIGTALALVLIGYFASTGIDFTAIYGDTDIGYPVRDLVYPAMSPILILSIWAMTGILAAIASLYPAARASRQPPVEALRYV
jgi:putative ABC transport system permease protein